MNLHVLFAPKVIYLLFVFSKDHNFIICLLTYRDGRLREQDQILAIDGQPLDLSHHEAIRILQSAQGLVQLVVARGPDQQGDQPSSFHKPHQQGDQPSSPHKPYQRGDQPSSPHKPQLSNVQSEGSADMVVSMTRLTYTMYSIRVQPVWL